MSKNAAFAELSYKSDTFIRVRVTKSWPCLEWTWMFFSFLQFAYFKIHTKIQVTVESGYLKQCFLLHCLVFFFLSKGVEVAKLVFKTTKSYDQRYVFTLCPKSVSLWNSGMALPLSSPYSSDINALNLANRSLANATRISVLKRTTGP